MYIYSVCKTLDMYEEMCEMFKDRQKIPSVICLLIILLVVAESVNKVQVQN